MTTDELIAELDLSIQRHAGFEEAFDERKSEVDLYEEELNRRKSPERRAIQALSTGQIQALLDSARVDKKRTYEGWCAVGEEMRQLGGLTPQTKLRVLRHPESAHDRFETMPMLGGVLPEDWK